METSFLDIIINLVVGGLLFAFFGGLAFLVYRASKGGVQKDGHDLITGDTHSDDFDGGFGDGGGDGGGGD